VTYGLSIELTLRSMTLGDL